MLPLESIEGRRNDKGRKKKTNKKEGGGTQHLEVGNVMKLRFIYISAFKKFLST